MKYAEFYFGICFRLFTFPDYQILPELIHLIKFNPLKSSFSIIIKNMRVIAKKAGSKGTHPAMGYVKPIFKFDEARSKYIKAEEEMFPNDGDIFIYSGYSYINTNFKENELFELSEIKESNTGRCLYSASSIGINKLKSTDYVPIRTGRFDIRDRRIGDIDSEDFSTPFLLRDDQFLYGPMNIDLNNRTWVPIDIDDDASDDLNEEAYAILDENRDCVFKFEIVEIQHLVLEDYIIDINDLFVDNKPKAIYAGSKEQTIAWGKKYLVSSNSISEAESKILNKISEIQIPILNKESEKQKFDKFSEYLHEINEWVNIELPKSLTKFLASEVGVPYVERFLTDNATTYFKDYRKKEFEEAEAKLEANHLKIRELQLEQDSLKQAIETQGDKIFEGIDDAEKNVLKELIKNESQRKRLIEYFHLDKSLNDISISVAKKDGQRIQLDEDIKAKRKEIDSLEGKRISITEGIKNVKDNFFKEDQFAQKLFEAKIYTDILNNIDPSNKPEEETNNLKTEEKTLNISQKHYEVSDFILEIQSRLKLTNRQFEFNEVANYLISIQQNFLTILAGQPGIGKTSLVEKLARALGTYNNNRFLSIPVQKGWTSSKDLVGYFNPITSKYQPAKTQLLKYLQFAERDAKNKQEFPCIILLDEANLSPIEHYWSEFSYVADKDYKKEIKLHEGKTLFYGDGVRFVATINYDHTTEILSDRLISRTPIIKLTKADQIFEDELTDEAIFDIFPMSKIDEFLKITKDGFKGDVKSRFESIVKKLEEDEDSSLGQPITISPRKYRSVANYCSVASNIMSGANQFIGLDYAINQNILTLINGRGENYRKRLVALQEKLQGLPLSSKHLDKIISAGDQNFKYYKYFY